MISNNEFDDWGQQQAPQDANPDGNPGGVDLMQVAMRRKGLIALGIFVGLCLGLLYYAQATPIYESVSMLSIDEKAPPIQSRTFDSGQLYQQTPAEDHAIRIRTPRIISEALNLNGEELQDLPSLAGEENKVETIYEGLIVEPIKDGSEILTLQYRGTHPEDCQIILNQVMRAYENFLEAGQRNLGDEMSDWIQDAEDRLQVSLDQELENFTKFRDENPELFLLGEGETLAKKQLLEVDTKLIERESRLSEIDGLIAIINKGWEKVKSGKRDVRSLLRVAEEGAGSVPMDDGIEQAAMVERLRVEGQRELQSSNRVVPLQMQLENLLQRYGEDYPLVKSLRRQIAIAEKAHRRDKSGLQGIELKDDRIQDAADRLKILVGALVEEQTLVKQQVDDLRNRFGRIKEQVTSLEQIDRKSTGFQEKIARLQGLYDEITQKVADVDLLVAAGGKNKVDFQIMQKAADGLRVEPSLAKSLAAGTMLGFLAGFGLGYLVEMFDKTFRSPQEVSKVLQLPMIGHIPEITCKKPEESALAEVLVTAHKPKSPLAENFRAIRTALYFSTSGQQNRVIQTTSPVPGDGKSTLTANIAVTIAQSNKSVLLIDADFRRPTQHKLFGITNDLGLASVVTGESEPDAAVQTTEVPNLYLMACGPRPHNPSELLTSPQFADLLEVLREQYDFVLIDTPPVLAVTDPGIVSARVDGVIMCLRIRKNGRPSAVRARKVLHDLDANMLGIVVNGIDHRSGSYGYYSSYRRGYGYNYAYKYGYGYGMDKTEKAINKYFEEPKPDSTTSAADPTQQQQQTPFGK